MHQTENWRRGPAAGDELMSKRARGRVAITGSFRRSHTHARTHARTGRSGQRQLIKARAGTWPAAAGGGADEVAGHGLTGRPRYRDHAAGGRGRGRTRAAGSRVNAAMGATPSGPDLSSIGPGRRRHLRLRKAIMRAAFLICGST